MSKVYIYTDGGCRPNPGKGASASLLVFKDEVVAKRVEVKHITTNNEMELMGLIQGLVDFTIFQKSQKVSKEIILYIDSQYVINGAERWMYSWKKRNWLLNSNQVVKNKELWIFIYNLIEQIKLTNRITFRHVKAHTGNLYNEMVDNMCTQAILGK